MGQKSLTMVEENNLMVETLVALSKGRSSQAASARATLARLGIEVQEPPKFQGGLGPANRKTGKHTRFKLERHHYVPRSAAALDPNHPAIRNATTMFPRAVVGISADANVLVSGVNSAKIGKIVVKGPWCGMPVYTLTLEERATCPRSCVSWRECYGNGMPMAIRRRYSPEFVGVLSAELRRRARQHPQGFVVRVHMLGDFPDMDYVLNWAAMMREIPELHVFGYTAHGRYTAIGAVLARFNAKYPGRWAVRFSVSDSSPVAAMQAAVHWGQVPDGAKHVAGGIICPQQTGATEACVTCGLCWAAAAAAKRIIFLGHGQIGRGRNG